MAQTDTGYSQAVQDLETLSTILARQADKVVRLYETDSTAKLNGLRTIQIIFLICALLLLVIGAWVTRQSVLEPLAELGVAATRAGQRLVLTYSGEMPEVLRNAFGSQTV